MIGINSALEAASVTRISLASTGSVLAQVAPQFAIQAARLIQEALNNAKGKLDVAMAVSPEMGRIGELMAAQMYNSPLLKPISDGPGEEAEQAWGSLGDIEFGLVDSPDDLDAKDGMNYVQHAILGGKPALQYAGSKLQEITLKISLYAHPELGADVGKRMEELYKAMRGRDILELVVGKSTEGSVYAGDYLITEISHKTLKHNGDGSIYAATLTVKLLEWGEAPELEASKVQPKAVAQAKQPAPAQKAQAEYSKDKDGFYVDASGNRVTK